MGQVVELKQAWVIPRDELRITRRIDEGCEGATGQVFLVRWGQSEGALVLLAGTVCVHGHRYT